MKPLVKFGLLLILLLCFWCIFDYSQDPVHSTNSQKSTETKDPWGYLEKDGVYVLADATAFATDEESVNTVVWSHLQSLVSGEAHLEITEAMFKEGKLRMLEEGTRFKVLALNGQSFHGTVMIKDLDSGNIFYFSPWEYLQLEKRFVFPFRPVR